MKASSRQPDWFSAFILLLMLLPLLILFFLPGGVMLMGGMWFWLLLLACFMVLRLGLGSPRPRPADPHAMAIHGCSAWPKPMTLPVQATPVIPAAVAEVMDVRFAAQQGPMQVFRGPLKVPTHTAYERLKEGLSDTGTPLLQEDETFGAAVLVLPMPAHQAQPATTKKRIPWLNFLLLGLTLITTTWAGAAHAGVDILREPARFAAGLPYALGLMLILGVHELGHYFAARHHGIDVTPPFFIPVPFALGTFGAFIQMKSPAEHRKALFDMAVAGPLAGLVIAIPALIVGLHSSVVVESVTPESVQHMGAGTTAGSSILFAFLAKLSLGANLQYGHIVKLSPLAFAGWLGLFITALNLLPIGQLDGGHIARAMFGSRTGGTISRVAMWTLFLLALFVWPGLFMWAIIVFFMAGQPMPPLEDLTPISRGRKALGYFTFIVLALIIAPLPHALWSAAGIHCPYL